MLLICLKKIGFEEKFVEYMKKAIFNGDNIASQFAGIKLIEYFNSIKEYSESELIGESLYKNTKIINLLYWDTSKVFIGKRKR